MSIKSHLAPHLPGRVSGSFGPHGARLGAGRLVRLRIIVEASDLEPGRTKSHAVAKYVSAAVRVQALRREFARAIIELNACKHALSRRARADTLMAEAEALCEELNIDPTNR